MKPETSEQVKARIDSLDRRYAELCAEQAKVGFDLEHARDAASLQFLDANDLSGAKLIGDLNIKADLIARGLMLLEQRKATAETELKQATVFELREKARGLRDEAAGIEKKCDKAITELSKLQDVQYTRSVLETGRTGGWMGFRCQFSEFLSPSEMACEPVGVNRGEYAVSKSRRLLTEADALETQANEIEALLIPPVEEPAPGPVPKQKESVYERPEYSLTTGSLNKRPTEGYPEREWSR